MPVAGRDEPFPFPELPPTPHPRDPPPVERRQPGGDGGRGRELRRRPAERKAVPMPVAGLAHMRITVCAAAPARGCGAGAQGVVAWQWGGARIGIGVAAVLSSMCGRGAG